MLNMLKKIQYMNKIKTLIYENIQM